MADSVLLHGYRYSVYAWIAALVLREKGVAFDWVEIDPFAPDVPEDYLTLNPFCRVPLLVQGGTAIYETVAITRYVDEAFTGPPLQPHDPLSRARQAQIISIIDSYAYWPMVRQVFVHGFFAARFGEPVRPDELKVGLTATPRILKALADICGNEDTDYLLGDSLTLADIHLYPMLTYLAMVPDGAALLHAIPALATWRERMSLRPAVRATTPEF